MMEQIRRGQMGHPAASKIENNNDSRKINVTHDYRLYTLKFSMHA